VPVGYRAILTATMLLVAGQGMLVGVFAFLFLPGAIEGFAPLDEPASSVRRKIALVVAVGIVSETAILWSGWGLLRTALRGLPARRTLRWAMAVEVALLIGALLAGAPTGAVGTGLILVLLAACYRFESRR
jgi:hypothetical protein